MNWITTNIRFPEDMYMDLKMKALKKRQSIAHLVRKAVESAIRQEDKDRKIQAKKLIRKMDQFAKKMAKKYKGLNLSKALIEMRYEQ